MASRFLICLLLTCVALPVAAREVARMDANGAGAGCPVTEFEAEDGKIEAKCKDAATGAEMEVYIDPATGKVVEIKAED